MHIAIIGSGSSAFSAAIYAAEKGAKVTVIEAGTLGGTCVNVGCVPSKIMIRTAHIAHIQQHHNFPGLEKSSPKIHRALLQKQQQERVEALRQAKYTSVLEGNPNITLVVGFASFKDKNTLLVKQKSSKTAKVVKADHILIATGRSPFIPAIPGLSETPYWTSTEALESKEIPKTLTIIGGSVVAVELGQAFQRLGAKVTMLVRSTLLSKEEPLIGETLMKELKAEGMTVLPHTQATKVVYAEGQFSLQLKSGVVKSDRLMVASGRQANTAGLELKNAGVETDAQGSVLVDCYLKTNVSNVYASGDCTNQPQYVYVAADAGARAAANMLGMKVAMDLSLVPGVVFTDPQIAVVGLTETAAKKAGISAESRVLTLDNVPRALANFDTRGFIKIVAEKGTGRMLGAQAMADGAGDIIQTAMLAIRHGMTVRALAGQLFPYLTMVEGLKLCAQTFMKDVNKLSCCAGGIFDEVEVKASSLGKAPASIGFGQASRFTMLAEGARGVSAAQKEKEEMKHDCCTGGEATVETVDTAIGGSTIKPLTSSELAGTPVTLKKASTSSERSRAKQIPTKQCTKDCCPQDNVSLSGSQGKEDIEDGQTKGEDCCVM